MIPLLLMNLADGTLDTRTRDGIVSATGVGALRFRDGGALVEEAGTNWYRMASGSGSFSITKNNTYSYRIERVATSGYAYLIDTYVHPYAEGAVFTVSGEWRGETTNDTVNPIEAMQIWEDADGHVIVGGSGQVVTAGLPVTTTYQPFAIGGTIPVNLVQGRPMSLVSGRIANIGEWIEGRRLQIEDSDHATTPIPEFEAGGVTLKPGYAWTGTAHASASTRAAASILAPCELPGWVAVRYSEDFGATWDTAYLETLGTVGTYGQISHDGTNLVLASDRATIYGQVIAGNGTLSPEQQAKLIDADGDWAWDMFVPRFGGIHVSAPIEPITVAVSVPVDSIAVGGTGG